MIALFLLPALTVSSEFVGAETKSETADSLKTFVFDQYPPGSDYFINGSRDTTLFRCVADFNRDGRSDIALSEKSFWGNRPRAL